MELKAINEKEYIDKICAILKVKKIDVEQYIGIKDAMTEYAVKVVQITLGLMTALEKE
jgi:hypothetical protein